MKLAACGLFLALAQVEVLAQIGIRGAVGPASRAPALATTTTAAGSRGGVSRRHERLNLVGVDLSLTLSLIS